jgi:hypothetical protein
VMSPMINCNRKDRPSYEPTPTMNLFFIYPCISYPSIYNIFLEKKLHNTYLLRHDKHFLGCLTSHSFALAADATGDASNYIHVLSLHVGTYPTSFAQADFVPVTVAE